MCANAVTTPSTIHRPHDKAPTRERVQVHIPSPSGPDSWPWLVVLATVAILASIVGLAIWNMTSATNGMAIFSLDDGYIHLAMARTLAESGTWGISPGVFSATSSSPLYFALLALAFLLGTPSAFWAWFLAIGGGLIGATLVASRVGRMIPARKTAVFVSILLLIGIGLPEIMMTGMEHTLHIGAVLTLLTLLEKRLESTSAEWPADLPVAACLFVAAGIRYETLLLIPPVAWVLWQRGMRRSAIIGTVAGVLPALILGIFQLSHGAMLLPNSIALKGVMVNGEYFTHLTSFRSLVTTPEILMMLIATTVWWFSTFREGQSEPTTGQLLSFVFFATVLLHGTFARMERRYIGYLLAMGFWTLLPAFIDWFKDGIEVVSRSKRTGALRARRLAAVLVVIVLVFPFLNRTWELRRLALIGQDIYAHEIQGAPFLSAFYRDQPVGLNDIGTTSWAGENRILDFWGLADNDIARMRMHEELTPDQMSRLARERGVNVVAIYSHWFLREKGLPNQWELVGRWQIPSGLMTNAASNAVDFYATSPEAAGTLRANLQRFAPELPAVVRSIL